MSREFFARFSRLIGRAAAPAPSFKVLVPMAGGPNAPAVFRVLPELTSRSSEVTLLHVARPGVPAGAALANMRARVDGARWIELVASDPVSEIVAQTDDHDLLVLGAGEGARPVSGSILLSIVTRSRCPAIAVRASTAPRRTAGDTKALVVAEGSRAGMLGLERALRWARAGSSAQALLLGPAEPAMRALDPERRSLKVASRGAYYRVASRALDATEVLSEAWRGHHDLIVIAVDPEELARGQCAWVDDVVARAACPVVCAFSSRTGPQTRRRRSPALATV